MQVFSTAQVFATDFPAELTAQVFTRTLLNRTICAKFIHSLFEPTDWTRFRISLKRPSELQVFASNGRQNCKFSHQTAVRTASFRIKRPSELQTAVRTASFRIKRPSELFASTLVNWATFGHCSKRLCPQTAQVQFDVGGWPGEGRREAKFADLLYRWLWYATFC